LTPQTSSVSQLICFSANTSWYLYNFRRGLIGQLLEHGYQVKVVAPRDKWSTKLEELGCSTIALDYDSKSVNPFRNLVILYRYWFFYRAFKPIVVLNYTIKPVIYGGLAASICRIPIISVVPGLGTAFIHENLITHVVKLLYRLSLNKSKHVIFENLDDLALFRQQKLVSVAISERIAGPGVDTDHFKRKPAKHNDPFIFLYIGRLLWDKGIGELVEASRMLRDKGILVRVQLLGPAATNNKSSVGIDKVKAWENEEIVEYLGETDDVRPFIEHADCIVLPSYREGLPGALLEACAMARPVIASNVPGCREIVEHGCGMLCTARSSTSLLSAMEEMIGLGREKRKVIGEQGRKIAQENYSLSVVNGRYLQMISNLVGEKCQRVK